MFMTTASNLLELHSVFDFERSTVVEFAGLFEFISISDYLYRFKDSFPNPTTMQLLVLRC